ncbi:hypothetical protein MTO96_022972 [Rhipicephalus appendiculatus]
MFVFAEYEHSFDTAVVEHTRVRNSESERFEPEHVNDFDRMTTYYVQSCRRGSGDSRKCAYEGAKIIHMTVTLEEMAMFKANRPRLMDVGRRDVDEEAHDTRLPLCKDRDHIREEERQQQIDDALKNYKLERPPMGPSTDLQQRLLAMEKELERLRQGGKEERPSAAVSAGDSIFKSAYADLEKKYKRIQTDFTTLRSDHAQLMKRFEDRNRAILAADEKDLESMNSPNGVRHRTPSPQRNGDESKKEGSVHSDAASDAEPESAEPDNDQEMNGDSDREQGTRNGSDSPKIGSAGENGKIYAGNGFWIDKQDWCKLFGTRTDARFCKFAASLFWTTEELRVRSVTGTLSNRFVSSGKYSSRLSLTPEKLATVKGLFRHYAGKDPLAQQRQKSVRRHLSNTLCNIRRHGVVDLPRSLATKLEEGRP